jgi:hypothetical protein
MDQTTEQPTVEVTATFTWSFPSLQVEYSSPDGLQKVVQAVHWTLTGVEDGEQAYTFGVVSLPSPQPEMYTEYDELTQEQVQGWVIGALTQERVDQMMISLQMQINDKKAPKTGNLPPPWTALPPGPAPTETA